MREELIVRVESMTQLKEICKNGYVEFNICLNGGCYSRKRIQYLEEDKRFFVFHYIDESWNNFITEKQLGKLTNIPSAIEVGALIYDANGVD